MNFEQALTALKEGKKVARGGWNGADMFLYLVEGSTFTVNRPPLNSILEEGTEVEYRPHIDMRASDGTFGVWLASQTDLLSEDWVIVE